MIDRTSWKYPEFDETGMTRWHWVCQHHENLSLGRYVDIGAFSYINASCGVSIGENTAIGSHTSIYSVSYIGNVQGKVTIGRNVQIGTHSVIMPGVTIGEGAVIGAHSFVKTDIPERHLAYGVPARVIRRVTQDDISLAFIC